MVTKKKATAGAVIGAIHGDNCKSSTATSIEDANCNDKGSAATLKIDLSCNRINCNVIDWCRAIEEDLHSTFVYDKKLPIIVTLLVEDETTKRILPAIF